MDDIKLRKLVSETVGRVHGNQEFIRQIAEGQQDDGPYMVAAFAVRDWFLKELLPKIDPIEE
jgi:hypothetical protein